MAFVTLVVEHWLEREIAQWELEGMLNQYAQRSTVFLWYALLHFRTNAFSFNSFIFIYKGRVLLSVI